MLLVLLFAVGATSAQFGFSSLPAVPDLKQHVETLQEGVGHVSDAIGGLPDTSVIPGKEALEQLVTKEWGEFKNVYNKSYTSLKEDILRKEIFIENRAGVALFNKLYGLGKKTFVQQLNPFADLLSHEFNKLFNGLKTHKAVPIPPPTSFIPTANVPIPDSMDWREKGAVTAVKYQAQCACCYAFAAAGALEGHIYRKTGVLHDLSPQNIMDCSISLGNDGCNGGFIDTGFEFVKENGGVNNEETYPFEAKIDQCKFKPDKVVAECTGYVMIPTGDEEALKNAVATLGPVAAGIDASHVSFQRYSKGIYYESDCRNDVENINHAVLVVGYGVEANGDKYWIVKNTYGPHWGMGGYFRLARDSKNHCGIASYAYYPLV